MSRMTAQDFVNSEGNMCPCCRSDNINWGRVRWIEGSVYLEAVCGKCETSFSSIARVAGYFLDDEGPVTVDNERTNDASDNNRPDE